MTVTTCRLSIICVLKCFNISKKIELLYNLDTHCRKFSPTDIQYMFVQGMRYYYLKTIDIIRMFMGLLMPGRATLILTIYRKFNYKVAETSIINVHGECQILTTMYIL